MLLQVSAAKLVNEVTQSGQRVCTFGCIRKSFRKGVLLGVRRPAKEGNTNDAGASGKGGEGGARRASLMGGVGMGGERGQELLALEAERAAMQPQVHTAGGQSELAPPDALVLRYYAGVERASNPHEWLTTLVHPLVAMATPCLVALLLLTSHAFDPRVCRPTDQLVVIADNYRDASDHLLTGSSGGLRGSGRRVDRALTRVRGALPVRVPAPRASVEEEDADRRPPRDSWRQVGSSPDLSPRDGGSGDGGGGGGDGAVSGAMPRAKTRERNAYLLVGWVNGLDSLLRAIDRRVPPGSNRRLSPCTFFHHLLPLKLPPSHRISGASRLARRSTCSLKSRCLGGSGTSPMK